MSASGTDITMIRYAIADTALPPAFDDDILQVFWADALIHYPSGDALILREQVIVTCLDAIMADSAKKVTYRQNTQSENLSDITKHLKSLKAEHVAKLDELDRRGKLATRMAVTRRVPTTIREYPDS